MQGLWWLAVGVPLLVWVALFVGTLRTLRAVPLLERLDPPLPATWPPVSVISPARDEADKIEAAMKASLSAGYPSLQVVAVDDRSSDGTGDILERLAAADPRLVVAHVTEARPGWLGKLAALDEGVARATGDWLLFADADVVLLPGALERIVAHCLAEGLDYVTAYPSIEPAGFLAGTCYAAMGPTLAGAGRLWAAADPDSDVAVGMGAFILMRRDLLERSEGLEWLRLEVADDMGLGLLAARAGGRCGVLNARGLLRLPWYSGVGEMFDKLQKNWFGIVGRFEPVRLAALAAAVLWCSTSGLLALVAPSPVHVAGALAAPALMLGTALLTSRWMGLPLLPAFFVPLGCVLLGAMMIHANVQGVRLGGIRWRGVVYPSAELKPHQRVRL